METTALEPSKKSFKWSLLVLMLSTIFVLTMCAVTIVAIYLDVTGIETVGTLNNVASCGKSENCFTGIVTFTTNSGEEITFSPLLQTPFIYEMNERIHLNGNTRTSYKDVGVRYLESNPKIHKVALALHMDYLNKVNYLLWGSVVILFSWIASRDKPFFVLDLSKRKK